jgi:MFS family permease
MFILAFAGNSFVIVVAILLAGVADGPQLAAIFAVRQREAPERSRGQVFMTGASLKITAAAIGTFIAGRLATSTARDTLILTTFVQLSAVTLFIVLTHFNKQQQPSARYV